MPFIEILNDTEYSKIYDWSNGPLSCEYYYDPEKPKLFLTVTTNYHFDYRHLHAFELFRDKSFFLKIVDYVRGRMNYMECCFAGSSKERAIQFMVLEIIKKTNEDLSREVEIKKALKKALDVSG